MSPDVMITFLAATLFAVAWAIWLLPVGTCSQCAHCRVEQVSREREREAQVGRLYNIPLCPACGRHHQRGEDHPR